MKGLIEPIHVSDTSCTGLALIEDLGNCARLVFFRDTTIYESGDIVPAVACKILLPYNAIGPSCEMTERFLAEHRAHRTATISKLRPR
jgi:hypothetical protein